MRQIHWRRVAGVAALAAPVLMWSDFFGLGLARRGYNLLTRPFSDLATRGTPHAALFDLGFFVLPGLLTIVVGLGLWHSHKGGQLWRAGSALIVAAGAFLIATGIFQQDPRYYVEGVLHGTMAQTTFAIASVAPLVLFFGSADRGHLRPPRRLWLLAALAAFATEGIAIALRPVLSYPDGFFQRPFALSLTLWFVATGAWLLRVRRIEGLSLAD